jgi:FkbM family methyltransferase
MIELTVLDIGARYGIHPSFEDLCSLDVAQFHLFEMDVQEAERLKTKYKSSKNIYIYPIALWSESEKRKSYEFSHNALNSLFESNMELLKKNNYRLSEFQTVSVREVESQTIDALFSTKEVHFLKLDTEGSEYEILQGAKETLANSVLGVRSEVLFSPLFTGSRLFGDLHQLMVSSGFELLNLDYTGNGNKYGKFTLQNRYGKLLSSDAVWVIPEDRLFEFEDEELIRNIIRYALFLMLNNATDLAVDVLIRAVESNDSVFELVWDEPLFQLLHKKVLFLFKSLLVLPPFSESQICDAYKTIFNREFPLKHNFYQNL